MVILGAIAVAALGLYCQIRIEARREYEARHGRKPWIKPERTSHQ
jgi:hypothetical protein